VCDLETSRMGAPYIYDISRLRVKQVRSCLTPWQLGKGKVQFSTCGQHSEMLVSRHKNYKTTAAILHLQM